RVYRSLLPDSSPCAGLGMTRQLMRHVRDLQRILVHHESIEVSRRHRPAEEISLESIACVLPQERELADRLHALGDDFEAETMCQRDHSQRDLRILWCGDVANE